MSTSPWAELVRNPWARTAFGQHPARRCMPAFRRMASRASPATTRQSRRFRQRRAIANPRARRLMSPSLRKTTPARPLGSRAIEVSGSGSRRESVNSHNDGIRPPRNLAAAARPHASSLASTPLDRRDALGRRILEMQRLIGADDGKQRVRDHRRLAKALKDQLELSRVGRDVANGENPGQAGLAG